MVFHYFHPPILGYCTYLYFFGFPPTQINGLHGMILSAWGPGTSSFRVATTLQRSSAYSGTGSCGDGDREARAEVEWEGGGDAGDEGHPSNHGESCSSPRPGGLLNTPSKWPKLMAYKQWLLSGSWDFFGCRSGWTKKHSQLMVQKSGDHQLILRISIS